MARFGRAPVAVILLSAAAGSAAAQQTIFNHPSADVLASGRGYAELDLTQRFRRGFEGAVGRVVWGAGGGAELGVNLGPFPAGAMGGDPAVTPNAKLRLFPRAAARSRTAGLAGARLYLPGSGEEAALEAYAFLAHDSIRDPCRGGSPWDHGRRRRVLRAGGAHPDAGNAARRPPRRRRRVVARS